MEKKIEMEEELVGPPGEQRNWRGIIIAVLVILIVFALIIVAIILVTPRVENSDLGEPFTLQEVLSSEYQPRDLHIQWIKDKNIYVYRSRQGEVMEYNAETNKTTLVMDNSTFRQLNTDMYFVSNDLNYVLIAYNVEPVYRHSFIASYKIYDRYTDDPRNKLVPFPAGVQTDDDKERLQFAGWSPSGSSLTFVHNNNLYYQEDPLTTYTSVTNSGQPGLIFNGIPDWLYEEEVFHSNTAHWLSPKNRYVCYAMIDDTHVPLYKFPYYGDGTDIYGEVREIAYPKAGDKHESINPRVKLYVVETVNTLAVHKHLKAPSEIGSDYYLTRVQWQDETHVMAAWTNRAQNKSVLMLCEAGTADCYINLIEENSKGWVDIPQPIFTERGQFYLMVLPQREKDRGHWKHIAMIPSQPGGNYDVKKTFITRGLWDVEELLAVDEKKKDVYFTRFGEDGKTKHLYRVGLPPSKTPAECISCFLEEATGDEDYYYTYEEDDEPQEGDEAANPEPEEKHCLYVTASFSHNGAYYILHCQGPGVPIHIFKSTVDERHIVIEDNAELQSKLKKKAMPRKLFFQTEGSEGHVISISVMLPPGLNEEHITMYPILVHTYGGPGTHRVTEKFHVGFENYLISEKNMIYVIIDGRGSPGRGDRHLHATYRNLGTGEVQDQITGTKFIIEELPYVDVERIGIWGWSYGGFVTAHVLGDDSTLFNSGVAVSPVTDWRYYDTAYTEKYMGLANSNDNYKGYDNANVSNKVNNMRGKNVLLIHGTADDNVHFQHTAQFTKSLTKAGVTFDVQIYADKNHELAGEDTKRHMYQKITDFLINDCWDGGELRQKEFVEE